jgi:D-alanine-D-alanine ligase
VVGTLEVVLLDRAEAGAYTYANKENCEELIEYRRVVAGKDSAVARAEAVSLAAWRLLGCRDGGRVDLRCDSDGEPQFMEVNPLAGMHPEHSDLPMIATAEGMAYDELIRRIVESACERAGAPGPRPEPALP